MHATNDRPKLSVVVPIYNVDRYLDECLESVAAQEVDQFECIMVDDGSTDRSGQIAAAWADKDPRFRVVTQGNHGLGHARNSGVPHVKGEYLAFLDSDDVVPADAYRTMIETLDETGSDFATGNVHRFGTDGEPTQADLYRWMTDQPVLRTHVSKMPRLLRDHLAHNKVWRTSFWKSHGLEFPVGVLYEDVPATIPAHVAAKSVDVLPIVAILWRVRDRGDSSITQKRAQDPRHIKDRVDGMLTASRFIAQHADQALKDEYDFLAMRRDLRWYVDLYPQVDDEYRTELFSSVNRFLNQASRTAFERLPIDLRPAYSLIELGAKQELAEFVRLRQADQLKQAPVTTKEGRIVLNLDFPGAASLPCYVFDVTNQLNIKSRVSEMKIADGTLSIYGWAHLPLIPAHWGEQHISIWMQNGKKRVPAEIAYRRDPLAAADAGAEREATARLAFTAEFDVRKLQRWIWRGSTTWSVRIEVSQAGFTCQNPLRKAVGANGERPLMSRLRAGQWVRLSWKKGALYCRVRRESGVLDSASTDGDTFVLNVRTPSHIHRNAKLRIRTSDKSDGKSFSVIRNQHDPRVGTARVPIADVPGLDLSGNADENPQSWDVLFRPSRTGAWQLLQDPSGEHSAAIADGATEVSLHRSKGATVELLYGLPAAKLVEAAWQAGATLQLVVEHSDKLRPTHIVLRSRRGDEVRSPLAPANGRLTAQLPVASLQRFGESTPISAGIWKIATLSSLGAVPVQMGSRIIRQLPSQVTHAARTYTLTDTIKNSVVLSVDSDLSEAERGNANQLRLQTEFYPQAKTELRDAVVYLTYDCTLFSDSPREIFGELNNRGNGLEHLVVVDDQQVNVPDGATPVPYRSESYYQALAQSRYIITNSDLPSYFAKAPGQTVVQTWHSVGTQRIGLDIERSETSDQSYIDGMLGSTSDDWDYLVSPNPFCTTILKRALAFNATLLETAAPRNDIFHRPEHKEVAQRVKERLAIPSGKTVGLFAPLLQGDHTDVSDELARIADNLGEDHVVLYCRPNATSANLAPSQDENEKLIDVSDYPHVHELLLIADVFVTDYSPLACDFANTGRPIIFYVPDDSNHRQHLGKLYFDVENDAPGPLISDEKDLVSAIFDAERIRKDYDAKYRSFTTRFCAWDDGHAAARVVDAVFGSSE